MNQMKFYVDADGSYLGGWDANPPTGAIEVENPPLDARQPWLFPGWGAVPVTKQEALDALNAAYQSEFDALIIQYPAAEREGWQVQLREADAWELDNNAPTPCLSAMLVERNADGEVETLAELIGKIRAKNDAYAASYGALTGKRHRLERAVLAAESPEQLAAVVW